LKEKKFYVTSGIKYGADFLLYRDDPNFIHSEYLVYIKDSKKEINIKEIINGERISLSHKKKFLMASETDENKIKYYNLEWINI
jgi:tRNA-splicing endonuclease subunit Sen34